MGISSQVKNGNGQTTQCAFQEMRARQENVPK
jgi:hypothetical protein